MAEKEQGFETAFSVTRFVMRIPGFWPGVDIQDTTRTGISRYQFIPAALMIGFFITTVQTMELTRLGSNLNEIIEILTFADVPISIALVKHLGLTYNRKVLRKLLFLISEDWKQVSKETEKRVMWQKARLSRVFTMVEAGLALGRFILHTMRVIYAMLHPSTFDQTGKLIRPYYMRGYFIYDSQSSPNYEITWGCQIVATAFGGCAFAGADALFVALVFHLCGQLTNLQMEFKEIGKNTSGNKLNFVRSLARIVKKHRRICHMADTVEYCFNKIYLVQVSTSSLIVCLHGYSLVTVLFDQDDVIVELIFMVFFTLGFMYSMFVYCYVAECLSTESVALSTAIFENPWYDLPPKHSKLLLLPLQRTGKPLTITAGKFVVFSLNLFSNIVKTSAGYLSMLLALREKL